MARLSKTTAGNAESAVELMGERPQPEDPNAARDAAQGGDAAEGEGPSPEHAEETGATEAAGEAAEAAGLAEPAGGEAAQAPGAEGDEPKKRRSRKKKAEDLPAIDPEDLARSVAALLFASPDPLNASRLAGLLSPATGAQVKAAVDLLRERFAAAGLPIEIREIAGGWRLLTDASEHEVVAQLVRQRKADKITPAALETLAIVAYRQPVTKAEIEAIRGVQSGPILRTLVDRGLVRVTGRADQPGAPLQYGTTKEFLDRFGLGSLKDLPAEKDSLRE